MTQWGKGYAWNPVAFIDRSKDPEDPQEALEGFYVLSADFVKSFGGTLKTLAFTPVIVPVTSDINTEFGESEHVNFGGKLYFLFWDTDIDFLFLTGSSRTSRYEADFSRNIRTNFEIHGEWAWITDFASTSLNQRDGNSTREESAFSMLIGARYLTSSELTVIAEYYHNGEGFLEEDLETFYAGGPVSFPEKCVTPNFIRDYLFVRASQKEPWGVLYFTPEITSIVNVADGSLTLLPGFTYSPRTNLQLRLRGAILAGGRAPFLDECICLMFKTAQTLKRLADILWKEIYLFRYHRPRQLIGVQDKGTWDICSKPARGPAAQMKRS